MLETVVPTKEILNEIIFPFEIEHRENKTIMPTRVEIYNDGMYIFSNYISPCERGKSRANHIVIKGTPTYIDKNLFDEN